MTGLVGHADGGEGSALELSVFTVKPTLFIGPPCASCRYFTSSTRSSAFQAKGPASMVTVAVTLPLTLVGTRHEPEQVPLQPYWNW